MPKKKRVFKLTYQVDFEYFQEVEQTKGLDEVKTSWRVTTKKSGDDRDIAENTPFRDRIVADIPYLDKHLPEEIEAAVVWLYVIEAPQKPKEGRTRYFTVPPSDIRNLIIDKYRIGADKRARKRLEAKDFRMPKMGMSASKKEGFVKTSVEVYRDLQARKRKRKIAKGIFAVKFFEKWDSASRDEKGRSNVTRDYDNLAQSAGLTFKEIEGIANEKV